MRPWNAMGARSSWPFAILSSRGEIRHANQAYATVFAKAAGDTQALTEAFAASSVLSAAFADTVRRLGATSDEISFRWAPPGDPRAPYDASVTPLEGDTFLLTLTPAIYQRRRREIDDWARAYLEAVLDQINTAVLVVGLSARVTYVNAVQATLLTRLDVDARLETVIGSPVAETYPVFSHEEWRDVADRVIRHGQPVSRSAVPYPRHAPESRYDVHVMPLKIREECLGGICITEDVTRLVALEQELIERERLAIVGQVAISVNHAINNPLAAIVGNAEVLRRHVGDPATLRRLDVIRSNALRIAEVTRRLRTVEMVRVKEYVTGGPTMLDLEPSAEAPTAHRAVPA